MTAPPVAVVHLVRRGNPAGVFSRFIESYRAHRSGVEHELLILMKGYAADERVAMSARMGDLPCRVVELPDAGFDIGSYLECARRFRHRYFMFMNSFSVIAADDWLKKLLEPLLDGSFGATGATASWESNYTNVASQPPTGYGIGRWVRWHAKRWSMRRYYPPFPNPHLRTNAFTISRDLFLRLKAPAFVDKQKALAFENGRFGMTRQIAALGFEVCVVDASSRSPRPGLARQRDFLERNPGSFAGRRQSDAPLQGRR